MQSYWSTCCSLCALAREAQILWAMLASLSSLVRLEQLVRSKVVYDQPAVVASVGTAAAGKHFGSWSVGSDSTSVQNRMTGGGVGSSGASSGGSSDSSSSSSSSRTSSRSADIGTAQPTSTTGA